MTNQEIDVTKCEFKVGIVCEAVRDIGNNKYSVPESVKSILCKNNPNCYYKQLKAKEREVIEWQTKYYNHINDCDCKISEPEEQNKKYKGALADIVKFLKAKIVLDEVKND